MDAVLGGRYQVLEKLGQGGMGEVFKGLDTVTERFVAIKHLIGTISDDKTAIERFRREAQALSDLNHPNIVKMLDMIQQDERYYLITEYIEGGDLARYLLGRGNLSVEETLKMGLELADALSRAHHLGIIHRDIKPANVLIAKDGTPRLTDFGVAHMESEERLTGTGTAIGTMDYLPPEALTGESVDVRADVWSFGVMLYEMLAGRRPFEGATTVQVLNNILQNPVPDLREFAPDIPDELYDLINRMLERDREARIRSVRQVGATLEAILQGNVSGLRRLQTPSAGQNQTAKALDDLPTTPVKPVSVMTPEPSSSNTIPSPQVSNQRVRMIVIPLMFVVIVGGVLIASMGGRTPEATPTPAPTEPLTAVVQETSQADASVERTPVAIANLPEDWHVSQGDYTAYAVPSGFVVARGSNRTLMNAIIQLIMGSMADADNISSLFNQLAIDSFTANLQGADLFFVATVYQESILPVDLETAGQITRGMFATLGENENVAITFEEAISITLPAGEASRTELVVEINDRPPIRSIYFMLLNDDGSGLYVLGFGFLESEAERMLPLVEQIAQTLTILK